MMNTQKIKIEQHTLTSGIWMAGWMFTLGFLKLSFWQSVFAIVIWPYYVGDFFSYFWGF